MKPLKDVNISRLFPSVIYRRGVDYYNKGRVSEPLYDRNHGVWTTTVTGTEDYFVEIDVKGINKGMIETYCDCPAFDTYGSCKHIVATLLMIQAKEGSGEQAVSYDYKITDRFIEQISELQQLDQKNSSLVMDQTPVQVEYHLHVSYSGNLLIELKFGENRTYVVKELAELIDAVLSGKEYFFTKNFTYRPEENYLLQLDEEVFRMLHAIWKNENIYHSTFYSMTNSADNRYMTIPPLAARELLMELANRKTTVTVADRTFEDVTIAEEGFPFQFMLEKSNEADILLRLKEGSGMSILKEYNMLLNNGVFYFITPEQTEIVANLFKFNINHHALAISKQQADRFFSEVIPSLKTVGDVTVAENIIEEVIQVPLQAKLYLELQDEVVKGKLEYQYGKHLVNPFNGRGQNDVIIIREVEKEREIMELIEHANFRYNGKELYLETIEEEELYEFLYKILPLLADKVELFLTSDLKYMIVEHEPTATTNVNLDSTSNLLEISFDIDGVDESEVDSILQAVIEKRRFYRLNSGAILPLENDAFSSINEFFDQLDIKKQDVTSGNVQMPLYRSTQIDELIDTKKSYDPEFRSLIHHLRSPEEHVDKLPENLDADLRNYQLTGYQWFKSLSRYHLGGILADDMGLGKTLQTIAYLASEPSDKLHLVVAPSSVVYNWKNEFDKFTPHLKVEILTGTPAERLEKIENKQDVDVWITSYSTVRQDIEQYSQLDFQTLILDEAQYIKNYATKTSQAIRQINASRRFALSGTPIENSIEELWAIFQVILPGLMPNIRNFKQLSNERIASITRPFILRRLKQDVLKELPDKIESVSLSELTKEQKELYVGYLQQVQQDASESLQDSGFNKNRMKILAGLTRLRQLCCHPSLFIENYQGESGKLMQLMETVKTALENDKRMLIFSQFTSMHELIIKELNKEGIDFFYLSGDTASEERQRMSERFNGGEKSVFLISLKAGGTGLNLTGADTVILYDLWWNPAVEDQATGRAHRFGQKNIVQVIRLIAEGTIEEKIYELQQKKRELINQVIQPGEQMLSSLSEDDIRELLSL
ncbi:DEAD/DEAH box helicase [Oceanobacillus indicireducens]|uniref:Helicase SNF2 n=1 Tax=Oceanobacillus indicireducens TaxID=1004261 RepID=A0A917XRF2_9BACI|nr:DEAD/DEAH box helicase [Oceanobacillus indicireducens]GGN50561.1 helicase SNF2 [Oceanobacillus indicireducens]